MKLKMLKTAKVGELDVIEGSVITLSNDITSKALIDSKDAELYNEAVEELEIKAKVETKEDKNMTIEVGKTEIKKKSFGETIQAMCYAAQNGGMQAEMVTKAVSGINETNNADGKYLTYTELFREIVAADIPSGSIWDKCTKIQLGDRATGIQIPYEDNSGNSTTSTPRSYNLAEGAQKTDTKLQWGAQTLTLFKEVIKIPLTWEIIEDVSILENVVKARALQKINWIKDYRVFFGAGIATDGYIGICTAGGNNFRALATTAATITPASVINLINGVLPEYRAGSEWWFSPSAWASMVNLNTVATSYTPSFSVVGEGGKTLWGYPVNVTQFQPALASNYDVMFGNPKTYYVAYRNAPTTFMDASFRLDYNESLLIVEYRSSGAPCLRKQTMVDATVEAGFSARA